MAVYGKLSVEVYDVDKPIGFSFGDLEFYSERLKDISGPVLEPACGNGRILIPLQEANFNIEGFDNSREMLILCRHHAKERGTAIRVNHEDMTHVSLNKSYAAIILPAGSFLLIHDRETAIKVLEKFMASLMPNGRLIFDVFLPDCLTPGYISTRRFHLPAGDLITLESKLIEANQINQTLLYHHRYEKWYEQRLVDTELEEFRIRWYGLEELRLQLEKLGFVDVSFSADYDYGKTPQKGTGMITVEAVKPGE
ncbi:class I SAM-dependent methyltransferase [Salisediminibacterium beveridgei]|uniref:Methyltransferase n=1 Tax=Salisediminibacterium beveridgei TaxID=632773 RepID=A0A1D7QWT5_9BACI|nr:class I SAM-dependent methyltransferase [Salisediminibacterium beveridgei]AOM83466.1 Methyltransferase [Salisediminibacterium beveridgei]